MTLIYQMGKVGSTSLAEAIPHARHLHTLYNNHPCPYFQRYTSSIIRRYVSAGIIQPLRRFKYLKKDRLKVISIVREPASRNISMFFQDLPFWITGYVERFNRETRKSDMAWLWDVYGKIFNHDYAASWFDKEILRFTGIDVMSGGFDIEAGYKIYRRNNIELLVLRLEDLQRNKLVLQDFINYQVSIEKLNESESKWYGPIYQEFLGCYFDQVKIMEDSNYKKFRAVFGYE